MKHIIKYFIDHPLIVNLLTVVIFFVGIYSAYDLQKEMFPSVDFDVVVVSAAYPGSSSEDVEKLVTITLERSLKGIDGIKTINGISSEGRSIVYLEIEPDAQLSEVEEDIKNAIDTVVDLPEDVDRPTVVTANNKTRGVLKIPLVGKNYKAIRKVAKDLRDELEGISQITQVNMAGYRIDEIKVIIDPVKMNEFEVTISEIENAIKMRNLNLSAGKIETLQGDIIVRTLSEFTNEDDVRNVIIRSNSEGGQILVSDFAEVTRAPIEGSILQRSNGKEAIFLEIKIKEKADIIRTTNTIKDFVKEYFDKLNQTDVSYNYVDDMSFYVKRRLNVLLENGLFGICLVFVCLLLFLNFSTSVVTSMGAPLAFMVSFIIMQFMGVSINLISMFGLILVLGMLVDDSIIVAEHFYQKVEDGMAPKEAAFEAAMETAKPVLATVLTTMIAFGALFFMGGIMGKFLWPVPAIVIICLVASLFECFVILPSHLADFAKIPKKKASRWYDPVIKLYRKQISFLTKYPGTVLFMFIAVFIGSIMLAKTMKFELFPGDDVRTVLVQLKGKVGTPLIETDKAMREIENIAMGSLDPKTEYDQIRVRVGELLKEHGVQTGTHYGSLVLYLTSPDMRERSTDEIVTSIVEKARPLIPGFNINVNKLAGGPPKGKAVDIELMANNLKDLKLAADEVLSALSNIDGVTSSELDFEVGKKQIVVKVNQSEAKRLSLNSTMIAVELRRALSESPISEIRQSDEDIEIKLTLADKYKQDPKSLDLLYITNTKGQRIKLSKVVTIEENPGLFVIRRLNRKRIISVLGTLDKSKMTPIKITEVMKPKVDKILKKYEHIKYQFGGENKNTKESMDGLKKAFLIAIISIFFILVIMFSSLAQPFIIMTAIPLGMIGVIWAFKLKGIPLGFMAMMGVVGLVGVVVNDSIVLVTFINKKITEIADVRLAVIEASVSRFRAVILTTLTTVAGLLPIAERVGGDPFIKPMAISFAYGLLVATAVTLVFIPCNYIVYMRVLNFSKKIVAKLKVAKL